CRRLALESINRVFVAICTFFFHYYNSFISTRSNSLSTSNFSFQFPICFHPSLSISPACTIPSKIYFFAKATLSLSFRLFVKYHTNSQFLGSFTNSNPSFIAFLTYVAHKLVAFFFILAPPNLLDRFALSCSFNDGIPLSGITILFKLSSFHSFHRLFPSSSYSFFNLT